MHENMTRTEINTACEKISEQFQVDLQSALKCGLILLQLSPRGFHVLRLNGTSGGFFTAEIVLAHVRRDTALEFINARIQAIRELHEK